MNIGEIKKEFKALDYDSPESILEFINNHKAYINLRST